LFTMLLLLPVLAAGMLGIYSVALHPLRKIPPHEYAQLLRAPAWLVTMIGGGIFLLSVCALGKVTAGNAQVFYGSVRGETLLMGDAYTFWGSALLGAVLALSAWAPAACRTLAPRGIFFLLGVLLLCWFSLLLLFSVQLTLTLVSWFLLLGGVVVLWAWIFHHGNAAGARCRRGIGRPRVVQLALQRAGSGFNAIMECVARLSTTIYAPGAVAGLARMVGTGSLFTLVVMASPGGSIIDLDASRAAARGHGGAVIDSSRLFRVSHWRW
jgi:hypothetical protein